MNRSQSRWESVAGFGPCRSTRGTSFAACLGSPLHRRCQKPCPRRRSRMNRSQSRWESVAGFRSLPMFRACHQQPRNIPVGVAALRRASRRWGSCRRAHGRDGQRSSRSPWGLRQRDPASPRSSATAIAPVPGAPWPRASASRRTRRCGSASVRVHSQSPSASLRSASRPGSPSPRRTERSARSTRRPRSASPAARATA